MRKEKGFTLVEFLISIAVLMIFAGVSIPLYYSLQMQNNLDTTVHTVVRSLRRAQLFSQAVKEDSDWGVRLDAGTITIFKGDSYANSESEFEEVFSTPAVVSFSGVQEVIFTKFSGKPQQTGTITCNSSSGNKSITLNVKGILAY